MENCFELQINGRIIKCYVQTKNVKNINARIKPDGCVYVSANFFVTRKTIEDFLMSKADFIVKSIEKFENADKRENVRYYTEKEVKELILTICEKVYPYYKNLGIPYPQIKFRKMVSQWGNCRSAKGILTFNTNLMYATFECIEYVVLHEFTHLLQSNHSPKFYEELSKVCPNWKSLRKELRKIQL